MSRKMLYSLVFGLVWSSIGSLSLFGGSLGFQAGGMPILAAIIEPAEWFDAGVDSISTWPSGEETELEIVDNGYWRSESGLSGAATYDTEKKALLDTGDDLEFDPTAKALDGNDLTVNAQIMFEAYEFDGETYPAVTADSKGALAVFVTAGDSPDYSFYGLAKDAVGGTNAWVQLTGGDAEAAVAGSTDVIIAIKCQNDGSIVVNYKVGDVALTLGGVSDIPFCGDGFNVTVASVGLKNAVEVDEVTGIYQEIDFTPTIEASDFNQIAGYDFDGSTISFEVSGISTNRGLDKLTYGVVYNGKLYEADQTTGQCKIDLDDATDFAAGETILDLDVFVIYHPYKSADGVLVTNSFAQVDVYQGAPDLSSERWIDITTNLVASDWDVAPEVENDMLVFEESSLFTATNSAAADKNVFSETKITFPEPNNLEIDFSEEESVPHGAFTLVQTAGDDPEAADAEFRFAFYGNGAWTTNDSFKAALNTEYIVQATFVYDEGKVVFRFGTDDAGLETNMTEVALSDSLDQMRYVGFKGAGSIEYLAADILTPISNPNLVEGADGKQYANIGDALDNDVEEMTLLWNQNFTPSGFCKVKISAGEYKLVVVNGYCDEVGDYYYFRSDDVSGSEAALIHGIQTNEFYTVDAAIASTAANDNSENFTNDTVQLLANISRSLEIGSDREFILDLNNNGIGNSESDEVLKVDGKLVITNSVVMDTVSGTNCLVKGAVTVADDASLTIHGGYFTESIASWIPSGLTENKVTIDGVEYYCIGILPLGEPLYIIDGHPCYTKEDADNWLKDHPDASSVVLIEEIGVFSNCADCDLSEELAAYKDIGIPGDHTFILSNKTDVTKLITVTKDGASFTGVITTLDQYAYEGLEIGGVVISDKTLGDDCPLSDYVELTDAFNGPTCSVDNVAADLIKARPQGDGSNGLSLFANWVLGIPVQVEGKTKGDGDIYDDHEGKPLMAIGTGGKVGGDSDDYIGLPFTELAWGIDYGTVEERADDLGYLLTFLRIDLKTGETAKECTLTEMFEENQEIEIPLGDGDYRVDLLIKKSTTPAE